jgi:hypothetical protein
VSPVACKRNYVKMRKAFRIAVGASLLLLSGGWGASCSVNNLDAILVPNGTSSGSPPPTLDAGETPESGAPTDAGETPESGAPLDVVSPSLGRKRGIAFGNNWRSDLSALAEGFGIGWWLNWMAQPEDSLRMPDYKPFPLGVEYVPMLSGNTGTASIASQVPAQARYLLTFNEPNFAPPQSNVTPAEAAAAWPEIVAFARQRGLQLVSPGVDYCPSNLCSTKPGNVADPIMWLKAFFAACSPACEFDYTGVSSRQCTKADLANELARYSAEFGKPLWITQFSCRLTVDGSAPDAMFEKNFMNDVVPILEADPHVFRYAWFTGRSNNLDAGSDPYDLLDPISHGGLTPLGADYVSQKSAQH